MTEFNRPATLTWLVTGVGEEAMPNRSFGRLDDAVRYVKNLPAATRAIVILHSGGKRYGPAEIRQLERELTGR
jgi:hypothetical protein